MDKQIVFFYSNHFFADTEIFRRGLAADSPCLVSFGAQDRSPVIDFTISASRIFSNLRIPLYKGLTLDKIRTAADLHNVALFTADLSYMRHISDQIVLFFKQYSIRVETDYYGQYYIDLSGTQRLFGRVIDTTGVILRDLLSQFGITAAVGIGSNLLTAYLAARLVSTHYYRHSLSGMPVYSVMAGSEKHFFATVPSVLLPGLTKKTRQFFNEYNIKIIKELQSFSEGDLIYLCGSQGKTLYEYAHNISRNFLIEKSERIIRRDLLLHTIPNSDTMIRNHFFKFLAGLCVVMREENIFPLRFKLELYYQDHYYSCKSGSISDPAYFERVLYPQLLPILNQMLQRRVRIKKIELSFMRFMPAFFQVDFFKTRERELQLSRTYDRVRRRFGEQALYYL